VGNPQATAIADARAARMRHLDETGVYVHVIAEGGMATGGDIAKAVVCGADGVMLGTPLARATEAPAAGLFWSLSALHPRLPRGRVRRFGRVGSLEQILTGPSDRPDGRTNLMGALRKSMAVTGYGTLKELQKADLMVTAPPSVRPGAQG
jgi:IMP dehydrogenase